MSGRKKSPRSSRSKSPTVNQEIPDSPFSWEQLAEFKEMFSVFDKDGDGKITMHEMESLVQACGYTASESDLDDICSRLDQTGELLFSSDDFLKVAEHFNEQLNMEEMLTTCCKVFFADESRITAKTLTDVLTGLGNPLTTDEMKQLLFNIFPEDEDDSIEIPEFVAKILNKNPDEED